MVTVLDAVSNFYTIHLPPARGSLSVRAITTALPARSLSSPRHRALAEAAVVVSAEATAAQACRRPWLPNLARVLCLRHSSPVTPRQRHSHNHC
jgi:hypothetical protein